MVQKIINKDPYIQICRRTTENNAAYRRFPSIDFQRQEILDLAHTAYRESSTSIKHNLERALEKSGL